MAIWEKPGSVQLLDARIMEELRQLAQGFDVYGQRIPYDRQLVAIEKYNSLLQDQQRLQLDASRVANEAQLAQNDADRVKNDLERVQNERLLAETTAAASRVDAEVKIRQLEMAEKRLQLDVYVEIERLQLAKAETFSRAMIAMINRSDTPEKLLPYLEDFGKRLLKQKTPEITALQLEDKADESK